MLAAWRRKLFTSWELEIKTRNEERATVPTSLSGLHPQLKHFLSQAPPAKDSTSSQ